MLEQMGHQVAPKQPQPGRLPIQPEVNSRGEVKSITAQIRTHYQGPAMPIDQIAKNTDRAESTQTVQPPEETKHTDRTNSTWAIKKEPKNQKRDTLLMLSLLKEAENQRMKGAEKPPPYRPPVPLPQRLARPETCCTVDVVDQLAKGKLREEYGSSFKNYPDYLSELQEKKAAQKKVYAAKKNSDNLEELADRIHSTQAENHSPRSGE